MQKFKFHRKGFTLIELLITLALVAIVSTGGFLSLSGYRKSSSLKLAVDELKAAIQDTQKRAITQESGQSWGIRFTNPVAESSRYEVFGGTVYSTSTVDKLYSFRQGIKFSDPAEGGYYDLVFQASTGKTSADKTISIVAGSGSPLVGEITINKLGKISSRVVGQ